MRKFFIRSIYLVFLCLGGCTALQSTEATRITSLRPAPSDLQQIAITVKRSDYSRALESSRGASNIRIVPMVVSAAQAPITPEYRLFNIRKGSVGELLGLENSDILVAAHDYVIKSPAQFYNYLIVVQGEKNSKIEIRRGNKPLLIKFDFIEG